MSCIILEGPDGAGKTTLLQKLAKGVCTNWGMEHHGLYPDDTGEDLLHRYAKSILAGTRHQEGVILDRCFLSERAYGIVMRGNDRLGYFGRRLLNLLCLATGTAQVICLPPWEVVKENWTKKRKDKWDPTTGKGDYVDAVGKAYGIYRDYERTLQSEDSNTIWYNYQWQEEDLRSMRFYKGLTGRESLPAGTLGSPFARVLVVGERVNTHRTKMDLPFFQLAGSSLYLHQTIREAGIKSYDLAFTNALTLRGKLRDLGEVARGMLFFSHAVALGALAAEACHDQGIPYIRLLHPAVHQRFHRKNHDLYINQFKEATQDARRIRELLRGMAGAAPVSEMSRAERRAARAAHKRVATHAASRPRLAK